METVTAIDLSQYEAFNSWTYFYPTRTSVKIPFDDNPVLDIWRKATDAIAQFKMNGDRNLIAVDPDGNIKMWNRHKEEQKYDIPMDISIRIQNMAHRGYWTVFDSELLHKRTKAIKDCLYFYDVLVWRSKKLVGMPYRSRYELLSDIGLPFMPLEPEGITESLYMAENFTADKWDWLWGEIKKQPTGWCEGMVLKHLDYESRLMAGDKKEDNCGGFMCRVRKPKKNYMF